MNIYVPTCAHMCMYNYYIYVFIIIMHLSNDWTPFNKNNENINIYASI